MRTLDLTPLFRSTIGFDGLSHLIDHAMNIDESALSYPPYNIEKYSEDAYGITMAVAGFAEEDLNITAKENALIVSGHVRKDAEGVTYLHRGIAGRAFERRFQIADHIRVTGASIANGLLHIDLVREIPEAMKPRQIKIETAAPGGEKARPVSHKSAA